MPRITPTSAISSLASAQVGPTMNKPLGFTMAHCVTGTVPTQIIPYTGFNFSDPINSHLYTKKWFYCFWLRGVFFNNVPNT